MGWDCTMAPMGNQGDPFFTLRAISKTFRQAQANPFKKKTVTEALRAVDLTIPRGKVTCLLGPNGAGKTTLIKILASLITPDTGEILYEGVPIEQKRKELQAKIAMVTPSERSFYWRLSGRENLLFYARLFNLHGKALRMRVDEVLETVGMTRDADRPYRLYSAGMKQKINIARTLLGESTLYLLDEPASHLDPIAREEFRGFIENVLVGERKATVFLCTHDLEEARHLGDELVVLHAGRVVAQGTRHGLLGSGDTRNLVLTTAGPPPAEWMTQWADAVTAVEGGTIRLRFHPATQSQHEILGSFVRAGGQLLEAQLVEADLLDSIKRITTLHA